MKKSIHKVSDGQISIRFPWFFSRADLRESMVFYDFFSGPMFARMFSLLVYLWGQRSSLKQEHLSYLFIDSLYIWEYLNRYEITLEFGILMKGTTNTSASQRTQVRWIDGSYLMIYAYKTQDIASCKTLKKLYYTVLVCPSHHCIQFFSHHFIPQLNRLPSHYHFHLLNTIDVSIKMYPLPQPSLYPVS